MSTQREAQKILADYMARVYALDTPPDESEVNAIQAIRDSRDTLAAHPGGRMLVDRYVRHVDALLEEVTRLQAQNAAMREIVQAVVDAEVYHDSNSGVLIVATPDQLVTKAHAILSEAGNRSTSAE